jgi:hypothetical protein
MYRPTRVKSARGNPNAHGAGGAGKDGERMFFWKKREKWREVRWFSGPRDIYLALRFAADESATNGKAVNGNGHANGVATLSRPHVERLASKDAAANAAQPPVDEAQLVGEIERAVEEYNRKNRFHLRVAGIRPRGGGAEAAQPPVIPAATIPA